MKIPIHFSLEPRLKIRGAIISPFKRLYDVIFTSFMFTH